MTRFVVRFGLITGQTRLLTTHVIALPIVAGWIFLVALALYWVTDRCVPLRVSRAEESLGLDLSQHGETLQPWSPNPHANPQS